MLLAGMVGWSGCADSSADTAVAFDWVDCQIDEDCPSRYSCQSGICAAGRDDTLRVALQVVPPTTQQGLGPQIVELDVTLGASIPDLLVTPPLRTVGTVLIDAPDPRERVPAGNAEIRFVPTGPWASLRETVTARTVDATGRWTAELPAGRYDVTITTARLTAPPTRFLDVRLTQSSDRTFVIPPTERARPLRGVLLRQDPETGETLPVPDVRVQAFSLDRAHVSTVDTTDSTGSFLLYAPLEASRYRLTVRQDPELQVPVPSVTFEPITLNERNRQQSLVFHLGLWGDPVPFAVETRDRDGQPLPNVNVAMRTGALPPLPDGIVPPAPDSDGVLPTVILPESLSYTHSVQTDDEGNATLAVFPETYLLTAVPLDQSRAIVVLDNVVVPVRAQAPPRTTVVVPERIQVEGIVQSAEGEDGVAGAQVTFELLRTADEDIRVFALNPRVVGAHAETTADGSFTVALSPGTYTVDIRPPERRGLARATFTLDVPDTPAPTEPVSFRMPDSGVVTGRALAPDGQPIVGAEVSAWVTTDDGVRMVATALSGAQGVYRLLLPASRPLDP